MGAWIETEIISNKFKFKIVAPYVGAWIETPNERGRVSAKQSHPMWVRGLKQFAHDVHHQFDGSHPMCVRGLKQDKRPYPGGDHGVAPYVGAWIETRGL